MSCLFYAQLKSLNYPSMIQEKKNTSSLITQPNSKILFGNDHLFIITISSAHALIVLRVILNNHL